MSWQDNIEELAVVAEPLLDRCRDAGLVLCVEPQPKQVLFDRHSVDAALDRLARHADVLRICLDLANLATLGYDPTDLMRGWRGLPVALHVKDLEVSTAVAWPRGPGSPRASPEPYSSSTRTCCYPGCRAEATPRLRALLPVSQPEGRTW